MKREDLINKVFQGDTLEIMRTFPDGCIDMILCDLPYGTTQNKWDDVIPLDEMWEQYKRIIKPNGAIVLTSQGMFTAKLMMSNQPMFKYKMVWHKTNSTNFLNAKKQPLRIHEDICVFYSKQPTYNPQMTPGEPYTMSRRTETSCYGKQVETTTNNTTGERYPLDVVTFKSGQHMGKTYHPTQKPVDLGRYFVRTFTNPGDLILDNTCGSGSFLLSAQEEGRSYCGIEYDTEYVQIANDRLREGRQQSTLPI